MKNKFRIVTLILAAALVLSLALGLFVACGETDATPNNVKGNVSSSSSSTSTGPSSGGSGSTGTGPSTGGGNGGAPNFVGPGTTQSAIPDGKITSTQYFDKFEQLSKSIGATAIQKGEDLYFRSEMSGTFGLKKEDGSKDSHFELGFEIEAILDRTSTDANGEYTSENSAIRARIFSGDVNVMAASFFVNDPLSLYIDFAGSHIKLSAEFVYKDNNLNEMLGRFIGKALHKEFEFDFGKLNFSFSLNKILDAIVEGTGNEWSPTVLLKSLAALIGFEDDGNIGSVDPSLSTSVFETLFKDTFNATKDGDNYSIILDTRDSNVFVHSLFSKLLGVELLFKMNFAEEDGRLKDGVQFELGIPELLNSEGCYPYLGVNVRLLQLLPVQGKTINMDAPLDEYKGNIAFKTEESLAPQGFKLFGSELREIRYSEAFMLDLVNPLETNGTAAQIRLAMVNEELGEDVLFDLSFVRGRLAIRFAPQVIFKQGTLIGDACRAALSFALEKLREIDPSLETRIADQVYVGGAEGDRQSVREDLNGLVVNDVPVREILDGVVAHAVDAYKYMRDLPAPELPEEDEPSLDDWGMPSLSELQKFAPANIMRQRILPALGEIMSAIVQLDDGKINVHTDSILDILLNISNDLAGLVGDERLSQSEMFDDAIAGACEALDWLAEKGFITYDEQTPDALSLMDSCFETLLDIFEIKDAPQKLEDESFTKYALRLLLGSTSFDLSVDLTDGWRYSMGFGVAGATVTYKHSFTTWEGLEVQDLYDNAENGWLLFDFADLDDFIK